MAELSTTYLGIKVKNPLVASSSGITSTLEKIKELEDMGIGAVVLKSLFEEQIMMESSQLSFSSDYPEAGDYIRNYTREHSIDAYLDLIRQAKELTSIPVIASINCVSADEWAQFGKNIQEAGADAIELNVYFLPTNKNKPSVEYENLYFDISGELKKHVNLPLSIKLGHQFTNLAGLVNRLYATGIAGFVLFNRFYQPDIDIEKMKIASAEVFSSPSDLRYPLRWTGILYDKVPKADFAASTGIHDGEAAIKLILAGAKVTQVCSTLYKNGIKQVKNILHELENWMDTNGYHKIDQFRGKLSYKNIEDPQLYERAQFMKYFSSFY